MGPADPEPVPQPGEIGDQRRDRVRPRRRLRSALPAEVVAQHAETAEHPELAVPHRQIVRNAGDERQPRRGFLAVDPAVDPDVVHLDVHRSPR